MFVGGMSPLHYENGVDSGEYNCPIDFNLQPSTTPLDGWSVTSADYHLSIGKKNGDDGWFGYGGRQGEHYLFFKLLRMGYMHWPTRAFQDVSGVASYDRSNLSKTVQSFDTGVEQLPVNLKASWRNIWNTPGGGEIFIDLNANGERLKLDIVLNGVGRDWVAVNRPPTTPIPQTYFGMVFKIDWSDIPKRIKNNIELGADDDFNDGDGLPVELRNAKDDLLSFMPIDYAYAGEKDNEQKIRLTKRFHKEGNNHYLFVGAKVADINNLPDGDIRFDPTFGPSQLAANDRDGSEEGDATWREAGTDGDGNRVGNVTTHWDMGTAWPSVTIPKNATITSATIEYFMKFKTGSSDIVTRMQGFDVDNVAVFSSSNRPSQIAQTTALVDRTYTSAGDYVDETFLALDDAKAIIEEIVARAGWSSGNALGVVLKENGSDGSARWQFQDHNREADKAAKITVVYTSPAGGTTILPQMMTNNLGANTYNGTLL